MVRSVGHSSGILVGGNNHVGFLSFLRVPDDRRVLWLVDKGTRT